MSYTNDIDDELRFLKELRTQIQERIEYLNTIKRAGKKRKNSKRGVPASLIRPHIQNWIDQGNSLVLLSEKAEVSESVPRFILSGRSQWITEKTTDKLLVALGVPHIYNEIVPLED